MAGNPKYRFRRVSGADVALLSLWQQMPHVRAWWGDDEPAEDLDLNDPRVARWVVSLDDRPLGYIQDYDVHGWDDHHFGHLSPGSRGIDQFIGDPELIGQGHGPGFISAHVRRLFEDGAPAVATDPDPGNTRAIAAYEKVGFRATGPGTDTRWGRILPMIMTPSSEQSPPGPQ